VSTEFHTGGGTILDVAIDGPRQTGVEIQHSYVKSGVVKACTTKSFRIGWLPVWFLDTDTRPPWFHQVPALNCNRLTWSSLPPPRAATALGLTTFSASSARQARSHLPGDRQTSLRRMASPTRTVGRSDS
jgi:hypothetical protein